VLPPAAISIGRYIPAAVAFQAGIAGSGTVLLDTYSIAEAVPKARIVKKLINYGRLRVFVGG
jgi:hypothetical protein